MIEHEGWLYAFKLMAQNKRRAAVDISSFESR
jgi:hypothetical protein